MKLNHLFASTTLPTLFREAPVEGTPAAVAPTPAPAADAIPAPSAVSGAPADDGTTPPVDSADAPVTAGDEPLETPAPMTFEDLALPEGFDIPEESREGLLSLLNDPELSRTELANKLIGLQAASAGDPAASLATALEDLNNSQQDEWRTALTALPNFGGATLDQNLAEVKQGMQFAGAGKEVFDALDLTGAGNHPALVPFLHKLVKPFLEANPVQANPSQGKLKPENKMFPDQN
jgi:hypothetical protein